MRIFGALPSSPIRGSRYAHSENVPRTFEQKNYFASRQDIHHSLEVRARRRFAFMAWLNSDSIETQFRPNRFLGWKCFLPKLWAGQMCNRPFFSPSSLRYSGRRLVVKALLVQLCRLFEIVVNGDRRAPTLHHHPAELPHRNILKNFAMWG